MPIEHMQLMESLCALVRRSKHAASAPVPMDVEAAVTAIGRRRKRLIALERENSWRLNLKNAKLKGAVLSGADLAHVVLEGASMPDVYLDRADLSEAVFENANLSRARLTGADLSRADLANAKLNEADLSDADLSQAKGLTQVQLDKAIAEDGHPPKLDGAVDAKTGKPLVWRNGRNGKAAC